MNLSAWKRQRFEELLQRFSEEMWALTEDSHGKGMRWEEEFSRMAESRGLVVDRPIGRADLSVNGKQVQCKSIDRESGGWIDVSNMRPVKANGGLRGYLASEIDVLALRHRGDLYLIPSEYMANDAGVLQPRVRLDRLANFASGWGVFDAGYVAPSVPRQMRLFDDAASTPLNCGEGNS